MRWVMAVVTVVIALGVGLLIGFVFGSRSQFHDYRIKLDGPRNPEEITVLDGDTLLVGSEVVRLAGIDAPELPPRSKCWAEAALARHSRQHVENMVSEANIGLPGNRGAWRVTNKRGRDGKGHLLASLTRDDGEDMADVLVVYGYAARTSNWDWCGAPTDLRDNTGPNLWYPPDDKIDKRADD
jgi:endonuclease YncB( thermonuclease family)